MLGRIRTDDLRRVKGVLALEKAFSCVFKLFFDDLLADEITTRNASAPSCTVWYMCVGSPASFEKCGAIVGLDNYNWL